MFSGCILIGTVASRGGDTVAVLLLLLLVLLLVLSSHGGHHRAYGSAGVVGGCRIRRGRGCDPCLVIGCRRRLQLSNQSSLSPIGGR